MLLRFLFVRRGNFSLWRVPLLSYIEDVYHCIVQGGGKVWAGYKHQCTGQLYYLGWG
jgi:hypothetical protein